MRIRRAFTLVELLIVISIISLLLTILLPSLQRFREAGRATRCMANLHALGAGMMMYLDDSKDLLPTAAAMPSMKLTSEPAIATVLRKYVDGEETFLCPSDPDEKYYRSEGSSYAYNTMLGGRTADDGHLARRHGAEHTPVMHDYEAFHGKPGTPGAMNYLFADLHVGDLE